MSTNRISGVTLSGVKISGPGVVPTGLNMYVDAGIPASYSGTGTTWTDISGAGHNGALSGTYTWNDAGQSSFFNFNYGLAEMSPLLPNTTYTKCVVFRYADGGLGVGNFISGSGGDPAHAFWTAGTPYVQAGHNGAWNTVVSSTATVPNQWYFAAVSFSNISGWRLYVNDDAVVINGNTDQFISNPALVQVSAFEGGNYFIGDIGAALCYERVLTDAEITQNYNYFRTRYTI